MRKIFLFILVIFMLVSCEISDFSDGSDSSNSSDYDALNVSNLESISIDSSEFEYLINGLKGVNNFSSFMIKEIEGYLESEALKIYTGDVDKELENDYYLLVIDETSVILDKDTNLLKFIWVVGKNGKRGNGYKREPNMPDGMEKGHIKAVNEGAKDNSIEDSPLNIIPQTPVVNDPNIKEFESYRVENCQGEKVITTIISEVSVRVEVPSKNIDVIYNPYSNNEWGDDWWFKDKVD